MTTHKPETGNGPLGRGDKVTLTIVRKGVVTRRDGGLCDVAWEDGTTGTVHATSLDYAEPQPLQRVLDHAERRELN